MKLIEFLGLKAIHQLDPETAHSVAVKALKWGLTPKVGPMTSSRLQTSIAGLSLPNPVGLAAGFDKNAQVIGPLLNSGFGFIEVGAATPMAQPGNPKPRLFRLNQDMAAINRFGFNNEGAQAIAARLKKRPMNGIVGLNLGANKTSEDRAADFAKVLRVCGAHVDFVTVNVSSPNTEKLRDLQGKAALTGLLAGVLEARTDMGLTLPVFLKIAPDLTPDEIAEIAQVAIESQIDAVIATNTTLDRNGLQSVHKDQMGGLSGQPLFEKSTRVLAQLHTHLNGQVPLIGVGGVGSAEQAYSKIKAGASVVQLYTALVFGGLSIVQDIVSGLDDMLKADEFSNVEDAVGTDRSLWL